MLIATDYARKMALDMRMIDPHYEDHPDNKASHCAKMIAEYYQKYDAQKGTQFVFSDLGTYQPGDGWNVYSEIKRKLTETTVYRQARCASFRSARPTRRGRR